MPNCASSARSNTSWLEIERATCSSSDTAQSALCWTWKVDLQEKLCDAFGLRVSLCHYPPACSKWDPIEYRLFSQMLGFIRGTTTTAGLKVEGYLDAQIYRNGRRVTAEKLKELALSEDDICPRWNYTLAPRPNR